jgi:hypothetical protein
MLRTVFAVTVLLAYTAANAGILGFLVHQSMGTSVTGKLAYSCTYRIGNQQQTVVLDHICPPSMDFQ